MSFWDKRVDLTSIPYYYSQYLSYKRCWSAPQSSFCPHEQVLFWRYSRRLIEKKRETGSHNWLKKKGIRVNWKCHTILLESAGLAECESHKVTCKYFLFSFSRKFFENRSRDSNRVRFRLINMYITSIDTILYILNRIPVSPETLYCASVRPSVTLFRMC